MGRLNKDKLEDEALIMIEGKLFNALSRREVGEIEGILRALTTPAEIEMMAKRLELIYLLSSGLTNKKAIESLKLSATTVSQTKSRFRYDRNLQKLVKNISPEGS